MALSSDQAHPIKARVDRIRALTSPSAGTNDYYEAAFLAQSVLHDTVGRSHPISSTLDKVIASSTSEWTKVLGICRSIVALHDEGALKSPRLSIARELEGEILDIAQAQAQAAELTTDRAKKQLQLAVAAFLGGASLEDALRRLCDANGATYDAQRSSIAKLQAALYQPSQQLELISQSENKQITAWGDTRNKADHGRFSDITQTEVVSLIMGTRQLIEKHFP
jgi:hypothetical protein